MAEKSTAKIVKLSAARNPNFCTEPRNSAVTRADTVLEKMHIDRNRILPCTEVLVIIDPYDLSKGKSILGQK